MRPFRFCLLATVLLTACSPTTTRYASAPTGYGDSADYSVASRPVHLYPKRDFALHTEGRTRMERNEETGCFFRVVRADLYRTERDSVLTYSATDAALYPSTERRFVTREEYGSWEPTISDCGPGEEATQVLCYRTHPAETMTYYEPLDLKQGKPYWQRVEYRQLIDKGGLMGVQPVDCNLRQFTILPVAFPHGVTHLSPELRAAIDEHLLGPLQTNSSWTVELWGHTDSKGTANNNAFVGAERARAVAKYLEINGVDPGRLEAEGIGEAMLLNACEFGPECTEEERGMNNRVEYRLGKVVK